VRFFEWLYNPTREPRDRPKPKVLNNIPKLKRKETSIYKPTDLWTLEDDLVFLKWCPSKRDRCYHAISRDLSARPHEILDLKIKDIIFKSSGNKQYAEVLVNGKTGTRHLPLIDSLPYVKEWLDHHPQRNNKNAYLICTMNRRNVGSHFISQYKRKDKTVEQYLKDLVGGITIGVPERILKGNNEYLDLGVTHFIFQFIGLDMKSLRLYDNPEESAVLHL
jgi:hypothetical protein